MDDAPIDKPEDFVIATVKNYHEVFNWSAKELGIKLISEVKKKKLLLLIPLLDITLPQKGRCNL